MEHSGDYYEEFEAITDIVISDIPTEESNPLNEFATDVSLSEVHRIQKYAFSPLATQRYTFIKNIKNICEKGDLYGVSSTIVPLLDKLTSDRDNAIRQVALNQFEYIANLYFEVDYLSAIQFVTTVAFPILKITLMDSTDAVQKASIEAFVACCRHIHREDQGIHTYLFILELAHSTRRDERIMACKLFHHTASILGSEIISQFGVSELLLLVRDPYCQVRKHAILALGPVSDVLDSEIIEQGIYNALLANTKSSSWVIRRACAIVIPEVFKNIRSHKTFLSITKPIGELFRDENPYVKQAMLQSLGHVISVIPDHFNINDDVKTRYLQLGNTKDDLPSFLYCRCCAFYFPSVLRALSSSTGFWKDMNDLYNRLSRHTDMIIRRSLAYSLHEVAEIIGVKNTEKSLVTVQGRFLQDIDDVRTGVIKNMSKFWKSLTPATRTIQAFGLSAILSQLKETRTWRLRLEISQQLSEFCDLLVPKNVLEVLAPIYLDLIQDPVEIVRTVAAEATYPILNKAIEADNKKGVVLLFQIITFAKSDKYNTREMFVLCCPAFTKLLSKHSFKTLIRPVILRLAKDPVPNVRECILHMLLKEPNKGVRKLYGFKKIVEGMVNDSDQEIVRLLSTHELTKKYKMNSSVEDAKVESVVVDDMSIIIEDTIFSGEDSIHLSPVKQASPVPSSFPSDSV